MGFGQLKFGRNVLLTLKNHRIKCYDIWFDFGSEKKKIVKNGRNFCKKMKFKLRLVAGNVIWPAKIRPEGPPNLLKSACKILWPHLENSGKKSKKTYPPPQSPPFLGGSDLKPTLLDNIHVACIVQKTGGGQKKPLVQKQNCH